MSTAKALKKKSIKKMDKVGRCQKCPTYHGLKVKHDPESYDELINRDNLVYAVKNNYVPYCPWRKKPCIAYPIEREYALSCHNQGVFPDIETWQ